MLQLVINPVFKFTSIQTMNYFLNIIAPAYGLDAFKSGADEGEYLVETYGEISFDSLQDIYNKIQTMKTGRRRIKITVLKD